ncbi:CDK-activating kinase assembly factor MAT1-like [Haliotis asinina]|uniref:CDK-activating kinase assembly factor MAT1-like n=1 Tax=Haliotis asinina TaxID=109174 RepID=UPI0035319FE8
MDEQGCPRCKTTKYRNPSLKLLVNVCGHSLCESCVDMLFIKGSGACPECGTALRRNNFRLQIFEDSNVEKELDIRKKILRDFNKKEEDFSSLRDYNDYLEMIETIVFNLTNGIDVESTRKMIEQYRKDNKDQIKKNLSKMSKDQEYLDQLIEQEKHDTAVRKQMMEEEAARDKAFKKKNKAALIDELMFSDMSATDIVATHRECVNQLEAASRAAAPTTFSTGIKIGHHDTVLPLPGCEDNGDVYVYLPYDLNNSGPSLIDQEAIHNLGYLSNVRPATDMERGGGFEARIACQRALHDALSGLFYFPETDCSSGLQPMVT